MELLNNITFDVDKLTKNSKVKIFYNGQLFIERI